MNNINPIIFKAYDIRGIYPTQINADLVYKITQAYAKLITPKKVAIGYDVRLSGQEFANSATHALIDAGVDVVDIGLVSTDALYFAVASLGLDGGIQITASHNPKEYGGMKMVRKMGQPVSGDTGIYEIRDMVISNFKFPISNEKGKAEQKNVFEEYIKHILKTFGLDKIKPLKIVANTNFGMASVALKRLAEILPIQILEVVNGELDGNFPKGRPDPLLPENRGEIIETINKLKPDLGVAWDADADRCFFFDENGKFVTPAYINALLSEYYLKKYPGGKIVHDTRVVRVIDDAIKQNNGKSIITKAGHSFIKERMFKEDAVFGSETSGHYYFKDNFYLDNGIMPFLAVLDILSSQNEKFSQILKPLREKFYISEEINFEYSNKKITDEIKEKYKDAKLEETDGQSFEYPSWRVNVRKANTENLLRINLEANSEELLKEKTEEMVNFINTNK
jgi:phosphomannomutase